MDHIVNISEDTIDLLEKYIERAKRGVKRASVSVYHASKRLATQKAKYESAEADYKEAKKKLSEQQEMIKDAAYVGKKVLYGQDPNAINNKLLYYDEDEEPCQLYDGPCLISTLDAQKTKHLVDKSPLVKRSHIVDSNSVLMELKTGKMVKMKDIINMDYSQIFSVTQVDDKPRTAVADMFTKRCESTSALERVIKAASSNEGKVLFSRELLLEMGVHNRGIRCAIEAICNTPNGRKYETNELLYLKSEGVTSYPTVVIANPIKYRSRGVFCALADPKEALGVLGDSSKIWSIKL